MDPLSGFFILEGIIFGIVGTMLLVSGILQRFTPSKSTTQLCNLTFELHNFLEYANKSNIDLEDDLKRSNGELKELERSIVKELDRSKLKELQLRQKEIVDKYEKNKKIIKDIFKELSLFNIVSLLALQLSYEGERNEFNYSRIYQGYPFLLCGFLLNGVGIILQLLTQ